MIEMKAADAVVFVVIGGPNGSIGVSHDGVNDFTDRLTVVCPACGAEAAALVSDMENPVRTAGGSHTLRAWLEAKRVRWWAN